MATSKKFAMSEDHKAALAAGRNEGRAIRNYLEALESHKPKRGRKRTAVSVQRRLNAIEVSIPSADPLSRVKLLQEQMDLQAELGGFEHALNLEDLEQGFVKYVAGYSERKGISYAAWRALGVPVEVLRRAGVRR